MSDAPVTSRAPLTRGGAPVSPPSRSPVRRAGELLRASQLGDEVTAQEYVSAYDVLVAYRAAHQYPLVKATNSLRAAVKAEGCRIEVSQRLKRMHTILDKLRREPEMDLSRMQDFGGCRAILENVEDVRRVQARVLGAYRKRVGDQPPVKDYIAAPKETGYRGVHIITMYDGRRIEVQLRTKVMHEWAITVERLSGQTGFDLKGTEGPSELREFFAYASTLMAREEAGEVVDAQMLGRMSALRESAVEFLSR